MWVVRGVVQAVTLLPFTVLLLQRRLMPFAATPRRCPKSKRCQSALTSLCPDLPVLGPPCALASLCRAHSTAPGAIVCTIEKANALVNAMLAEDSLSSLSAIIVDELHMVGPRRCCGPFVDVYVVMTGCDASYRLGGHCVTMLRLINSSSASDGDGTR